MGTEVSVITGTEWAGVESRVQDLFEAWEQALSRFRATSELCALNAGGGRPFRAGPILLQAAAAACAAARRTSGLFDPTLLAQLEEAGYDRDFDQVRAVQPARRLSEQPGGAWREISLKPPWITLPAGCRLDFGGIGKGLAVDAAVELLAGLGVGHSAVDAGGDLRVLGLPPGMPSWPVAVETARDDLLIGLRGGALATSSTLGRRWRQGRAARHHLIDPRTGVPAAGGVVSVTVAAPTCERAEVDAKVALVLGSRLGPDYLERSGVAGLVVAEDGSLIPAGPWPAEV